MKIRVVALSTPTLACARPATIQEEVHAAISSPFYAVSLAPFAVLSAPTPFAD
jgi:hypothetical protein